MTNNMPADVQARIRALPGNDRCADCNNITPQWASVSYGTLVCLECSGQHRSLGVHLSFVRSVAMDSWTEKQIAAMEKSGGNAKLVEYLESRGIPKTTQIATKYNTKQAAYYRERLSRWLEGKTEPPPDPGRWDPVTGVSEAQGAEPLPGETTEEYNARQARLREAARERLRAKFGQGGIGGGGMTGIGSDPGPSNDGISLGGVLGGAIGGVGNFLRNNVIENQSVRGAVGGVASLTGDALNSIRQSVAEGQVIEGLKSNVTGEEGTILRKGMSMVSGTVGSMIGGKDGSYTGGGYAGGGYTGGQSQAPSKGLSEDDEAFFANIGRKNTGGYGGDGVSNGSANGGAGGLGRSGTNGSFHSNSGALSKKASNTWNDDDWGDSVQPEKPPPVRSSDNVGRGAKDFGTTASDPKRVTSAPATAAAPAPAPAPTPAPARELPSGMLGEKTPKKPAAKLEDADDFFSKFGV